MNAAYIGWHIPRAYEFALASENWHNFEHACFFFTNLMFWWPIIQPWPSRPLQLALGSDSLSAARRRGEHGSLGFSLLLGTAALSELRRDSAALRAERAQRPGCRGGLHVGVRIDGVSDSGGGDRRAASFAHGAPRAIDRSTSTRPEAAQQRVSLQARCTCRPRCGLTRRHQQA